MTEEVNCLRLSAADLYRSKKQIAALKFETSFTESLPKLAS